MAPENLKQCTKPKPVLNLLLRKACEKGQVEKIRKLLEQGANPNVQDKSGRSPLELCMNNEAIQILISYGADLNLADPLSGNTPLHVASANLHYEKINQLLIHGADPNALNNSNNTPLHYLMIHCSKDDIDAIIDGIKLLVNFGANINVQNDRGDSPLLLAVVEFCATLTPIIVHEMLNLGADPHLENFNRWGRFSPLTRAIIGEVEGRYKNLVPMMMSYGVNIEYISPFDPNGYTYLHKSAVKLNVELMRKLLDYGADPNSLDRYHRSAMHLVFLYLLPMSYGPHYKMCLLLAIEQLVKHGANVNVQNHEGDTPLHFATMYCTASVYPYSQFFACAASKQKEVGLKTLLKVGADPYIRNHDGRSAFEEALKLNCINGTKMMLFKMQN